MPRKLDIPHQKKQIQPVVVKPVSQTNTSKHEDTRNNINHQVMQAFENLPWIQQKKQEVKELRLKEANYEEWEPKYARRAGQELNDLTKESRKENPQVLFDLLTNITKDINTDPVNTRFIDDFRAILRHYHKDIYAWVRNKLTPAQKDKVIFTTVMNALWNRIATHKKADLDWLAALKLLKECWFTDEEQFIREIPHKDSIKWYIQIDWGWVNGISVDNVYANRLNHSSWKAYKTTLQNLMKQIVIILDHHNSQNIDGKISHGTASSTYIVFKLLQQMDAIPADKYDHILRFVKFVDIVDSAAIEVIGKDFENSHRTLIGLQKLILKDYKNIDFIYNQFGEPAKTWLEVLSDEDLQETKVFIDHQERPLKELSDSKFKANEKSCELAYTILDEERTLKSPLNGEVFLVDLEGKMLNAAEIANYMSHWVIKILPDGKLFIYSPTYMKYDNKTWSTFGDYTRWHILFVDPKNIDDWSRFEKTLFGLDSNNKTLEAIRGELEKRKQLANKEINKIKEKTVVTSIINWALTKFTSSKAPMHMSDIKVGQEYDVVINNTKLASKFGVFVTFGKNADALNVQWKDGNINGMIYKNNLTPKQILYYQSLIEWESVVRVIVTNVIPRPDWSYKIEVWPIVSNQISESQNNSIKTA